MSRSAAATASIALPALRCGQARFRAPAAAVDPAPLPDFRFAREAQSP